MLFDKSALSPYVRFGCLSVRYLLWKAKWLAKSNPAVEKVVKQLSQKLLDREFYFVVAAQVGGNKEGVERGGGGGQVRRESEEKGRVKGRGEGEGGMDLICMYMYMYMYIVHTSCNCHSCVFPRYQTTTVLRTIPSAFSCRGNMTPPSSPDGARVVLATPGSTQR